MNILTSFLIMYLMVGAVLTTLLFMLAVESRAKQSTAVLIATWIVLTLGWPIVVPWMIKESKKGD